MGDKTAIEWTDATWNPVTGCTKVSQGCKFCYAERVFPRAYGSQRIGTKLPSGPHSRPRQFTDVVVHHDRLDQPLHWKKPRRIFVNSMSDLFHEAVPAPFIDQVFAVMGLASRHTFQVLTKRAERMNNFLSGRNNPLPNVHLGVSVEDQPTFDERWQYLRDTPAAVRFISYEPALGPVDFTAKCPPHYAPHLRADRIAWVICGGESGPNARPMHPDWARSVRDQCQAAGVPFFFKQWGEWAACGPVVSNPGFYGGEAFECASGGTAAAFACGPNSKKYRELSPGRTIMERVGKKKAGATLDGREWKEFPC